MNNLKDLRDEIDVLDKQLVELLEKRMDIVVEVIKCKIQNNIPIEDTSREEEVLAKNLNRVNNPDYKEVIKEVLKSVMDFSKVYQHGYLGNNQL